MKSTNYTTSQLLNCAQCHGEVVLCVPANLTASGHPYIDAQIVSTVTGMDCHGNTTYTYGITFEDTELGNPLTEILPEVITGIFCKGCLTSWVEGKIEDVEAGSIQGQINTFTEDNYFQKSTFFGGITDYTEIADDGTVTLHGDATAFEDLVVPLTATRQGATSKPDFDYTNIGFLFPKSDAAEILYFIVQMPHRYKEGTDIYPHVHYQRTAAGKPTFKIDYKWFNIGDLVPAGYSTVILATEEIGYVAGSLHQINSGAAISGVGKTISSLLLIKLYRDDGDVNGDVLTFQFDLHYEVDGFGSSEEYIK